MGQSVTIVVEGRTDAAVVRRLLAEVGLDVAAEYVMRGKSALDAKLAGFNSAARFSCWLVLRDLDQDAACAPACHSAMLPAPARHMRLHLAVRAVEAWLLADADGFGKAFAISPSKLPRDPELVEDPKQALVDFARTSTRPATREALVPAQGTTASVGPGYAGSLIEFAAKHWRPAEAATRSQSLLRLREYLKSAARKARGED